MRIGNCSRASFTAEWEAVGRERPALLKGLLQDKGEENYLRVLMLHFGCGLSMRETVTPRQGAKTDFLAGRFRRSPFSGRLLQECESGSMNCVALCLRNCGIRPTITTKHNLRLVDATIIKEPGQTGAQWRIHYTSPTLASAAVRLFQTPVLAKDYRGALSQFPSVSDRPWREMPF